MTRCAVMRTAEFIEGYIALEENDSRRRTLDAQFGKKTMARMVQDYTQEKENQAWLKEKTMACPGCDTHVEKSQGESRIAERVAGLVTLHLTGCNHMTYADRRLG